MNALLRTSFGFAIAYLALMLPTYVLPWMGSNSILVNAVGAAVGKGMTPQWWGHVWSLAMLVLLAWGRGDAIRKNYLAAIAFIAAAFDLTPVLSAIPFVPSICHLIVLIGGARGSVQGAVAGESTNAEPSKVPRWTGIAAGAISGIAVLGVAAFVGTASQKSTPTVTQDAKRLEKDGPYSAEPKSINSAAQDTEAQKAAPVSMTSSESAPSHKTTSADESKGPPRKTASASPQTAPKKTSDSPRVRYINIHE